MLRANSRNLGGSEMGLDSPWVGLLYLLTLTHMIFLKGWGDILGPSPRHFWWPDFSVGMLLPAFAFTLILSFGCIQMLLSLTHALAWNRLNRLVHLLLIAWALTGLLRMGLPLQWKMLILKVDKKLLAGIISGTGIVTVILVISRPFGPLLMRAAVNLILLFSPMVPLLWGQAVYASVVGQTASGKDSADQSMRPGPRGNTIWVLLFDELDQHFAFDNPPPGLELPAFSKFKQQAVTATQAYPPGNSTTVSVPSLLLGKVVAPEQVADVDLATI